MSFAHLLPAPRGRRRFLSLHSVLSLPSIRNPHSPPPSTINLPVRIQSVRRHAPPSRWLSL